MHKEVVTTGAVCRSVRIFGLQFGREYLLPPLQCSSPPLGALHHGLSSPALLSSLIRQCSLPRACHCSCEVRSSIGSVGDCDLVCVPASSRPVIVVSVRENPVPGTPCCCPHQNNAACPLCTMRSPELSRSILSCLAFAHNSADDLRCFSPPIPVTLRSRPHSTRSPSTFSLSPLRELATALPSLFSVPSVDGQILA